MKLDQLTDTDFDRLAVQALREVLFEEALEDAQPPDGFIYQGHPAYVLAFHVYGLCVMGPEVFGVN